MFEQLWLFIIFLNEHLLEAADRRCSAKKVFLKFHKIYSKKPVLWLLVVFYFKQIFPSFYIKMTGL